jgi:tripartite-type tricarboxylate transporter receptor subunit TctC
MTILNPGARLGAVLLAVAMVPAASSAARADAADFYKGKSVTINIGFGAGGGYDTYARVLARHYGRHIAGSPTVVPVNMPGSGALRAANFVYSAAKKDGTAMALVGASTLMEPLFGNKKALFDATKFTWIGSMAKDIAFCGIWKSAGVKSFGQWMKEKKQLTFGATGPAAITAQHPTILKNVIGANAKVLPGYKGTKDINLAMQRGEVDGSCGLFVSSIKAQYQRFVDAGDMILVMQMGPAKTDAFGKVPSIFDYAKTDTDKKVLEIHFGQLLLGRPFVAAPGVPADRAKALQDGFVATLKDPKLLADAKKARIAIEPVSAEEALKLLVGFGNYPKSAIDAAKKAIGR